MNVLSERLLLVTAEPALGLTGLCLQCCSQSQGKRNLTKNCHIPTITWGLSESPTPHPSFSECAIQDTRPDSSHCPDPLKILGLVKIESRKARGLGQLRRVKVIVEEPHEKEESQRGWSVSADVLKREGTKVRDG